MADFAKLYAKLDKQASEHDVDIAKVKCPKKQKPAIYVMLAREDTDDAVTGVEVDISKPTSSKKKTDGEGMAKFDPAKVGNHVARFKLTSDLEKRYFKPSSRTVTTSQGKTSTLLVLLRPLPSLEVIVRRSDGTQGFLGDVVVELSGPGKLKQTTAHGSGSAKFPLLKPARYKVKVTLTKTHLEWAVAPGMEAKEVTFDQDNKLIVLVHPKGKVDPTIAIEDPKVVIVKRPYMSQAKSKAKPHRLRVRLGASANFDGTGQLTCNNGGNISIFREATDGAAVPFPVTLTAAELNQGLSGEAFTLYMEGLNPSAGMDDVQLDLALQGGTGINGPAVNDKLTCVRLKIEIHKWRVDDTTDPVLIPEPDKIDKGRYIHVQNSESEHERAKIIVHQAEPAAFTGKLRVCGWDEGQAAFGDHLQLFDTETGDQSPHPNPLSLPNSSIPGTGQVMWVEGKTVSKDMYDAPIRLTVENIPDEATHLVEGDRVTVTVLKTTLQIHQSKTKHDADPEPMSEEDQIKKGRYLHEQDSGFHHGRALVLVKKVEPASFKEKLTLTVWDVTAKSKDDPRAALYKVEDEVAKTGQSAKANPFEFDHDGTFPEKGLKLWAEGKTGKVSAALRDTEIRLSIKDHMSKCGRAAVTVLRFKKLKADIPSTPAVSNRAGNSPVNRHEWKIADPSATKDHFDEDYTANKPFVLIENSITTADQVNLSVEVEPVGVPVRWGVIRDRRPSPDGDHKKVIGLSDNPEAPTLASDAEGLANTLIANAVGSFHICPFVTCNENNTFDFMTKEGKRIDREPFIMMNLVLVRVQGVSNDSKGIKANCNPSPAAGQTAANFGGFSTGNWNGADSGWYAKATVDVIGGGNDGLRGVDHVFGGWIQHIFLNNINSSYRIPLLPDRHHQYAFVSNLPDGTHPGDYHYVGGAEAALDPGQAAFALTAAPVLDNQPILDVTPYPDSGTGGDSAVGSTGAQGGTSGNHGGGYAAPTARTIGQRWIREMWDSPGIGCPSAHISAGGTLASFRFNLGFRTDLCFWTNTDLQPNASAAGTANRLYASVYQCTWTPDFEIQFHAATGAGSITTAKKIDVTKNKSAANGRAVPLDGFGLETRSPTALAWYAVDARG